MTDSYYIAVGSYTGLQDHNSFMQNTHITNKKYLDKEFWNEFQDVMRNDICGGIPYFTNTSNSTNTTSCEQFISGILTQVNYFLTLI
jgi:hypothetical protein